MEVFYNPLPKKWPTLTARPTLSEENLDALVKPVFETVHAQGDRALKSFTATYDRVTLKNIQIDAGEIDQAESRIPSDLKQAIQLAKENITAFHKAQKTLPIAVHTSPGVHCWQEKKAIEKVGLYIPGGSAPLYSTVLMLAIPAKISGCEEIVLCTPPDADGKVPDVICYTARLCGVSKIIAVGGIQAIAAMAIGTETVPKVYKIFGPGNQYVTAAKQWATKWGAAIDLPAGPSELLIAADTTAQPDYVAADLLAQAEHGVDSQVVLVTTHKPLIARVQKALTHQLESLPRKRIAQEALENSKCIFFDQDCEAIDFINAYAPEHYMLCMQKEQQYLEGLRNAGSVFIGNFSPESAGDYASGTNHTLPTNGYARQFSGVNLDSFQKAITYQRITEQGLQTIGPAVALMAKHEELQGHQNAVEIRLKQSAK